jgi:hypothetical protein
MKNTWWNNFKIRSEINAKTSQIRAMRRTIALLQEDILDNQDRIECYKLKMAEIDGNQMDLFIPERK